MKTHATTACTFSTLQPPKVVRTYGVLAFDFKMCFAPQWRALFQRLNCQKCSEQVVCFVHFDFEMCFAPQRRALFQHLNFQKCLRTRGGLHILTAKSASPHNSVHFFNISTAKSCSELQCFAHFHFDLRFAPQQSAFFDLPYDQVAPEPQNIGKTRRFPTFLDFRATSSSGY